MDTATTIDQVRAAVHRERSAGRRVGFVPTMGALHEGHLSLIRAARKQADFVVVSVFVNPAQFSPGEDFEAYPRDSERDAALVAEAGGDLLFLPQPDEIYPPGFSTKVRVEGLSEPLCGTHRPGHFDGVALVVTKLLNIVRPDVSVFGQKDAQQALLIRRLVRDLHLPGEIVVAPTVREADGLAMSSRNRYLSAEERMAALSLSRGLAAAARAWEAGERGAGALQETARREMDAEALVQAEYAEIRDLERLEPWTGGEGPALLAVAARVGRARLIDNVILGTPDGEAPGGGRTR
ncbi:MAG TPA: pantoate--beta-alanine ligase [bacterium]|nr:pantoate--beta-alanine ligase [bacterium]